jgi:hypothetical protein
MPPVSMESRGISNWLKWPWQTADNRAVSISPHDASNAFASVTICAMQAMRNCTHGIVHAVVQTVIVAPLRHLFMNGPRGLGFWNRAQAHDMCASLTGVSAAHWMLNPVECIGLIDREFEGTATLVVFVVYVLSAYWVLQALVCAPAILFRARRDERLVVNAVAGLNRALQHRGRANSLDLCGDATELVTFHRRAVVPIATETSGVKRAAWAAVTSVAPPTFPGSVQAILPTTTPRRRARSAPSKPRGKIWGNDHLIQNPLG